MPQEEAGIGLNGAILISPALELGGLDMNDYGVVQWVDVLPTMAGAAAHHGRGRAPPAGTAASNKPRPSDIGAEPDRDYRLLSLEVNQAWKEDSKKHFFQPPDGATDSFRYGMALNPHMRAFITHGRFDMVTPYYTTDRLRNLMRL